MKKCRGILAVLMLALVLAGCQKPKDNQTSQASQADVVQIDEKDERLMLAKGLVDEVTAFEYRLPKGANTVILWKDVYRDGKKDSSENNFTNDDPAKKGIITFGGLSLDTTDSEEEETTTEQLVVTAMIDEKGLSKTTQQLEAITRFVEANPDLKPDKQGTYPLYFEHYFYKETGMYTGLPLEFLYQPDDYLAEIDEGEEVYVYRLEFK